MPDRGMSGRESLSHNRQRLFPSRQRFPELVLNYQGIAEQLDCPSRFKLFGAQQPDVRGHGFACDSLGLSEIAVLDPCVNEPVLDWSEFQIFNAWRFASFG